MNPLYIILAVVAIVTLWVIMVYNGLIKGKNQVDQRSKSFPAKQAPLLRQAAFE
jgi:hypothetical protein